MTGYRKVSRVLACTKDTDYFFRCPGCGWPHGVQTGEGPGPRWGFNGNVDAPTFTPSVLVQTGSAVDPSIIWEDGDPPRICHTFITDGKIQFLSDCDHALAGQTVDIPDWNDDL